MKTATVLDNKEYSMAPGVLAYSYVRFSTSAQELGDSLRRQVEKAEEYCAKHGLTLADKSYRDLGVSAFKRKNIEKGALAAFIHAVKDGRIAKGSYLIIEQFDRLSRADIDIALKLLLDLVHSGIRIITLVDEKVWDSETVKDVGNLILAVVFMSRANNESTAKADRLSSVWRQKKKEAAEGTARRIVTSECPRWLQANEDKTGFVILEDKAESIRKVFAMRIAGYGCVHIVRKANQEKWPAPSKPPVKQAGEDAESFAIRKLEQAGTWHTSLINRLLKNRALLGEYQPKQKTDDGHIPVGETIPGYYPAIIDETTFLRAQAKADRDGRFPGRRDAHLKNWLQGLLRCECGQSFVRKNKDSKAQPGYARYYCTARNRGVTKCPSSNVQQLEAAVMSVVAFSAPAYFHDNSRSEELKAKVDMLEVELSAATRRHDRFVEAIDLSDVPVASLVKKVSEAASEVEHHKRELAATRALLADMTVDADTVFANIKEAIDNIDSTEARAALREELSRVIDRVIVHENAGYIEVYLRGSEAPILQPLRPDVSAMPGLTLTTMTEADFDAMNAETEQA